LAWIIEHRELNRVLSTGLRFAHGVEFCPAKAIAYEIGAQGVRIATDGGDAVRAALLIGADGSNSSVRTAAGLCARSKPYGQSGVVANFECEFAHGGAARQWFADDSILALLPLPDRACSMVWSAPTALAGELVALDPAELAQRVMAIAGRHTGALMALGGASAFPLNLVTASALAVPRVALVGDAAHVVHPLAGQGLNLGFQDAEDLLRILREREVFRDCGDPVLMRRYERARAFPVMAMRSATDGLQRLFGGRSSGIRVLRSEGMNFVQGLSVVKKALIRYAMS
jgi:2-polyprenylphenol 6-hydroxylase